MIQIKNRNIKSICILRLSAIGDVTHVLPIIATLHNANPNIKITWIIGKLEYKLLKDLPSVNFIVFDKSSGRRGYKELKNNLKGKEFDVLMQMQYSFRANRAAWKVKADIKIGFDKKRSREFHSYKLTHRIQAVEKQHVLDGFMEFVKVLGIDKIIYQWNIITSQNDKKFVSKYIINNRLNVVISPCSSNILRNWSNKNYAEIIDLLVTKYKANVILCGSPAAHEVETANEIEKLSNVKITNIAGKDTLKQLYQLMKQSDLVISPDSGPMHIANAAGTAVIGLHAATTAKRSGAYNYQHLAIDCFKQAAKKFLQKSPESIRWGGQIKFTGVTDLITVDMVKEKIDLVFYKS